MKTPSVHTACGEILHYLRGKCRRPVATLLATLLAGAAVVPQSAEAFVVRGIGESALIGGDLTDPDNNADPESLVGYDATFSASEEAGFPLQGAFNVFDNKLGGFQDKWCCGDLNNFPTNPITIDATFTSAKVLRHFTITSGEDDPGRDPLVWKIQGSNDGVTFTDIFVRDGTDSVWTERSQVIEFIAGQDYALPPAYTTFRFLCTKTGRDFDARFQLGEIEYFDSPAQSLVVSTAADENDGNADPTTGTGTSLREALAYAATLSGSRTITFSNTSDFGATNFFSGTARTITVLNSPLPVITTELTITGPGAKLLTITSALGAGQGTLRVTDTGILVASGLTIDSTGSLPAVHTSGLVILTDCALGGGSGGAVVASTGVLLTNCTLSATGEVFRAGGGQTRLINSTVFGGTTGVNTSGGAEVTLINSTVAGGTTGANVGAGDTLNVRNSIVTGTTNKVTGTISENLNSITDKTAAEAGLDPNGLQDNGGPVKTVKLLPGSPAIDGGDNSLAIDGGSFLLAYDARGLGFPRVVKGKAASTDATVDIGAFEVQVITFQPGVAETGLFLGVNSGALDLAGSAVGASPAGGTFSGTGVDANGVFRADLLAPGSYTITYTTTTADAYGNTGSAEFIIQINADEPYLRIVATAARDGSGFDVPNEGTAGTKFTQLGLASMDYTVVKNFGALRLVGARGRIKPPTGPEIPAIYQGTANTLAASLLGTDPAPGGIVVRGGDPAPNGGGGTLGTFASFDEPVFYAGYYAFGATITGPNITKANDSGLWSSLSGVIAPVALEGGPVNDGNGTPLTGVSFDAIQSYVITSGPKGFGPSIDTGSVFFVARLRGTGVTPANNLGIWHYTPSATRLVFRTGDVYDLDGKNRAVRTLRLFLPARTIPGQRRSYASDQARFMAYATFVGSKDEALLTFADFNFGPLRDVRLRNTSVSFPGIPSMNSEGYFAMRARLGIGAFYTSGPGRVTAKTDQVILEGFSQFSIGITAQEGSPISDTIPDIYTAFEEPALNDRFNTAFFADVTRPGLSPKQRRVLVYRSNGVSVLARTGTPAAGLGGGILWKSFTAMVLPDSDLGPAFLARLEGPGVNKTNDTGLWATNQSGNVLLLLRTGQTIPVNGANKTVSLINTFGAALNSPGQGRYVNQNSDIAATVTFTDGTTALVQMGVPLDML